MGDILSRNHILPNVATCWLFACLSAAALSLPARADFEMDSYEALVSAFQERVDTLGSQETAPPGIVAAFVLPGNRIGAASSGWADRETQVPMTSNTRLMSGSVGKSFVAAVALSLVQEGVLELDAKIETWLADEPWFSRIPNASDITLQMLLTHTSGVPDHVFMPRFGLAVFWKWIRGAGHAGFRPDDLVGFVLDRTPLFPAGTGYSYTDTGYILVGLVIERASGRSYYELLRERFLDPFHLELTVPSDQTNIPGLAAGYFRPVPHLPPIKMLRNGALRFNPKSEWTGGGLATNPQDLVRWAKLLYEERALPEPYLDLLVSRPVRVNDRLSYGLGVFIYDTPLGVAYGHGGWFPGYSTRMLYFPAYRIAVAIQCNSDRVKDLDGYSLALAETVANAVRKQPAMHRSDSADRP